MNSIFKYLYLVSQYIELEYDEEIGKKIQKMTIGSVPARIYNLVYENFKAENSIPNTAAELMFLLRKDQ